MIYKQEDYLSHHGIKDQKWGVRRFQNYDRTWTNEGKIRYKNDKKKQRKSKKSADDLIRECGNTKLSNIDLHDKKGNKSAAAIFALNLGVDIATLNVPGLVMDTAQGIAAISAEAKEKSAIKRQAAAKKDPKTGLPLKAKETTPEEDVKMVNPGYHNFNSNTKNNCVLCSTAFELRRRGYDVTAAKAGSGYNFEEYGKWFKGAKFESARGFNLKDAYSPLSLKKGKELSDWANDKILSQGEGARGYLSVIWGVGGGHSMAYEVKNNKVVVYDGQSGKKKSLRSVANASVDIGFTRLDDKEPNWAAMKKDGVI